MALFYAVFSSALNYHRSIFWWNNGSSYGILLPSSGIHNYKLHICDSNISGFLFERVFRKFYEFYKSFISYDGNCIGDTEFYKAVRYDNSASFSGFVGSRVLHNGFFGISTTTNYRIKRIIFKEKDKKR
ncbi:hypothetical protein EMIT040CA3_10274 [Bacillus pseudomycoides]